MQSPGHVLERHRMSRWIKPISARWLARPFPQSAQRRVVAFYDVNRITYSQLYPFFHYKAALKTRYGVTIRAYPVQDLLAGNWALARGADDILLQPWFTVPRDVLTETCARLREAAPTARISFLDSFAHNDLRQSAALPDDLHVYLKKSLYKDTTHYRTCYRDTYLSGHYAALYGQSEPEADFRAPPEIVNKLHLFPNFFTAPHLLPMFQGAKPPPFDGRSLDVQARLSIKGSAWYQAMRNQARESITALDGISVSGNDLLPLPRFFDELRQSRVCFSPFGYGEVCWRDIEAIATGAVLLKQDMSHLKTLPDLYEPGVTYLPISWDFNDLEDVLRDALKDPDRCAQIAQTAYERVAEYIARDQFVEDMAVLFGDSAPTQSVNQNHLKP